MDKFITQRRFIAGAVCPRCSAMDTIVVDAETDTRECIACDYTDVRPVEGGGNRGELSTRVNRPAARRVETPAMPVKILDPGKTDPE